MSAGWTLSLRCICGAESMSEDIHGLPESTACRRCSRRFVIPRARGHVRMVAVEGDMTPLAILRLSVGCIVGAMTLLYASAAVVERLASTDPAAFVHAGNAEAFGVGLFLLLLAVLSVVFLQMHEVLLGVAALFLFFARQHWRALVLWMVPIPIFLLWDVQSRALAGAVTLGFMLAGLHQIWRYYVRNPDELAYPRLTVPDDVPEAEVQTRYARYERVDRGDAEIAAAAVLLRSFSVDGTAIETISGGSTTMDHDVSLEQTLTEALHDRGLTVVKLGANDGGDARGATVVATTGDGWWRHAISLIQDARFVFAIPGTSESLLDEIAFLAREGHLLAKTVFLFTKADAAATDGDWEGVRDVAARHGVDLAPLPTDRNWDPCLIRFAESRTTYVVVRRTPWERGLNRRSIWNGIRHVTSG